MKQNETENNETRPDWLAASLLILGFILVSLFGFYSMLTFLVTGRIPLFMLPFIFMSGMGILYGRTRTARGSSATKQLFNATSQRIMSGSMAGIAATFLVYLVTQGKGLNSSWVVSFLILSIVWAPILGIPSGGVGGLILAAFWKHRNAAIIGGAIGGALFSLYWILNFFGS